MSHLLFKLYYFISAFLIISWTMSSLLMRASFGATPLILSIFLSLAPMALSLVNRIFLHKSVGIPSRLLWVLLFWALVIAKLIIDHHPAMLVPTMLGTENGMVIYFLVGFSIVSNPCFCKFLPITSLSSNYRQIKSYRFSNRRQTWDILSLSLLIYLAYASGYYLSTLTSSIRPDLFFIQYGSELTYYQFFGNLITINCILAACISTALTPSLPTFRFNAKYLFHLIAHVLSIIVSLTSMASSLLIGSNKGFAAACLVGLFVVFSSMFPYLKSIRLAALYPFELISNLFRLHFSIPSKQVKKLFSLWVLFATMTLAFLVNSEILGKTRLTRFGASDGLFGPRIQLIIDNFWIHFDLAPFWGHINVDEVTTGSGTYIHSLPIMLLTHTGLLGFILFAGYLITSFSVKIVAFASPRAAIYRPDLILQVILSVYFCVGILLICCVGTSFVFGPLWLSLGMLLPAGNMRMHGDDMLS